MKTHQKYATQGYVAINSTAVNITVHAASKIIMCWSGTQFEPICNKGLTPNALQLSYSQQDRVEVVLQKERRDLASGRLRR